MNTQRNKSLTKLGKQNEKLRAQLVICIEKFESCADMLRKSGYWGHEETVRKIIREIPKSVHLDAAILRAAEKHEIENNKPKIFCNCSICKAVKARQEIEND